MTVSGKRQHRTENEDNIESGKNFYKKSLNIVKIESALNVKPVCSSFPTQWSSRKAALVPFCVMRSRSSDVFTSSRDDSMPSAFVFPTKFSFLLLAFDFVLVLRSSMTFNLN